LEIVFRTVVLYVYTLDCCALGQVGRANVETNGVVTDFKSHISRPGLPIAPPQKIETPAMIEPREMPAHEPLAGKTCGTVARAAPDIGTAPTAAMMSRPEQRSSRSGTPIGQEAFGLTLLIRDQHEKVCSVANAAST
jgi:hypothetical protein